MTSFLDSLWWVIPGQLAGMRKPSAEELPDLNAAGIGAIVSVMDDPSNLDLYEELGMPWLWLPISGGTPPTREQVQQFQDFVHAQLAQDRAIAVHCSSGRRRTGTLLAAYLIRAGWPSQTAIERVQAVNPAIELREAQIAFLKTLS